MDTPATSLHKNGAAEPPGMSVPYEPALADFPVFTGLPEKAWGEAMAQLIQCRGFPLAFSYEWVTQIVDQFDLVPVPKAPEWLVGAANIDGMIVPVVDLGRYFAPETKTEAIGRQHRLLLGGRIGDSNEQALAILFSGLPFQIAYERAPLPAGSEMTQLPLLPEALADLCRGLAVQADGKIAYEIRANELVAVLALAIQRS